ncbi:hypothetical protein DFH06DRAFT_180642 [Mycena polygramma]|nr:hypothetical protein DFH06DRAFT_180642 [Mycena polygramma]
MRTWLLCATIIWESTQAQRSNSLIARAAMTDRDLHHCFANEPCFPYLIPGSPTEAFERSKLVLTRARIQDDGDVGVAWRCLRRPSAPNATSDIPESDVDLPHSALARCLIHAERVIPVPTCSDLLCLRLSHPSAAS